MSLKRSILAVLLLFTEAVNAAGAESCQYVNKSTCVPLTQEQELAANFCVVEMKQAKCDEFFKANPQIDMEKRRDCNRVASCSSTEKIQEYTKACLDNWGGAWGDMFKGVYEIATGDLSLSSETKARETFFENCTSVSCKTSMLGPHAELFSKEEIAGHPNDKNLDPKDPVNQAYLQGLPSKVLYKKLIEKISKKMRDGKLDQPYLEPWTGRPAKPRKPLDQMITEALNNMGVRDYACYDPVVLSEMRCYALFSVLDPLAFVGAAGKVAALSGRGLEKAIAKATLAEETEALEKANKLAAKKAHTNPEVDEAIADKHAYDLEPMREAVKADDPAVVFWKEVGVHVNKNGELKLSSAEVAQKIDTKVDDLVKSGKIKESDTLRPVLLYEYKGKTIGVGPNEIPPAGAVRRGSLLKEDEYLSFVGEGKYPMGDGSSTRADNYMFNESTFLHDTDHFVGFINNPEFMSASRQAANRIRTTKDPALREVLSNRLKFAEEYSQVFPKQKLAVAKKELEGFRGAMGLQKNTPYSYNGYLATARKLDQKKLADMLTELSQSQLANARPDALGGAEHLIPHRMSTDPIAEKKWPVPPDFTNVAPKANVDFHKWSQRDLAVELANSLAQSDAFMNIRPQDWVQEGVNNGRAKLSPLGRTARLCQVMVDTGKTGTKFYQSYCTWLSPVKR